MLAKNFKDFTMRTDLAVITVGFLLAIAIYNLVEAFVRSIVTPIIGALVDQPVVETLSLGIGSSEIAYGSLIVASLVFAAVMAAIYLFIAGPYRIRSEQGTSSVSKPERS